MPRKEKEKFTTIEIDKNLKKELNKIRMEDQSYGEVVEDLVEETKHLFVEDDLIAKEDLKKKDGERGGSDA